MISPVSLVAVDPRIRSSYDKAGKTGGPRASLVPLCELAKGKAGLATADTADSLLALHESVTARGGDFRVTECHRDVSVQSVARAKYDRWRAAGSPKPGTAAFNAATMKAAFVAMPGESFHNAGRAIDIHIGMLRFPGVSADRQLDTLWELAQPLGWRAVIARPDESASEAWHLDHPGSLAALRSRDYALAARVAAELVGHGPMQTYGAVLQAALIYAGASIACDGMVGRATLGAVTRILGRDASAAVAAHDDRLLTEILSRAAA